MSTSPFIVDSLTKLNQITRAVLHYVIILLITTDLAVVRLVTSI